MSVERWFVESREAIAYSFEDDYDLFCKLLAGTSLITDMRTNVTRACLAYIQLKLDGQLARSCYFNTMWVTLHKILNGGEVGRKVYSLYQNLIGNEDVVPIDRWMLRYFGYEPEKVWLSPKLYNELEGRIKAEADKLGLTPAQRQVQLWCQSRGRVESYGDVIRRKQIHRKNLLNCLI